MTSSQTNTRAKSCTSVKLLSSNTCQLSFVQLQPRNNRSRKRKCTYPSTQWMLTRQVLPDNVIWNISFYNQSSKIKQGVLLSKWLTSRLLQIESSIIPQNVDLASVITNKILKNCKNGYGVQGNLGWISGFSYPVLLGLPRIYITWEKFTQFLKYQLFFG